MRKTNSGLIPLPQSSEQALLQQSVARQRELSKELGKPVYVLADDQELPHGLLQVIHESPWLYYWAR